MNPKTLTARERRIIAATLDSAIDPPGAAHLRVLAKKAIDQLEADLQSLKMFLSVERRRGRPYPGFVSHALDRAGSSDVRSSWGVVTGLDDLTDKRLFPGKKRRK